VSALQAQVRAAIQQVRTSTPHDADCAALVDPHSGDDDDFVMKLASRGACDCIREARVDARLAACVEAAIETAASTGNLEGAELRAYNEPSAEAVGLAAFLAAAAQKETI